MLLCYLISIDRYQRQVLLFNKASAVVYWHCDSVFLLFRYIFTTNYNFARLKNVPPPLLTPGSWCGELSSPTVTIGAENIDNPLQPVTTETRRLNQTCATLFESLAPAEMSKTSIAFESQDHLVSMSSSVREESLQKVLG